MGIEGILGAHTMRRDAPSSASRTSQRSGGFKDISGGGRALREFKVRIACAGLHRVAQLDQNNSEASGTTNRPLRNRFTGTARLGQKKKFPSLVSAKTSRPKTGNN